VRSLDCNAGIIRPPSNLSLTTLRASYAQMFEINVSSVACMCTAFISLLRKSDNPKFITITSGLGSISNCLNKKIHRLPAYGTSKVSVNGLTVQLQVLENKREEKLAVSKDEGGNGGRGVQVFCSGAGVFENEVYGMVSGGRIQRKAEGCGKVD
jgi:NAD(P)-dependent dehydrogenase (short-subunit alcohol dehydrogenase family)